MMRNSIIYAGSMLLPFGLLLAGCAKSAKPEASQKTTASKQAEEGVPNAAVTAAFAELSTDDRAIALKQRVCLVSGELLGEMGAPIKVDVNGQPVFICCEGCREELLAKPDEYLAKMNK